MRQSAYFSILTVAALANCSANGLVSLQTNAKANAGSEKGALHEYEFELGRDLRVARPAAPLTYSDSLAAKRAAMAFCAGRGARLSPAALGRFGAAGWQFDGGCL
jgi:hypothetical protein